MQFHISQITAITPTQGSISPEMKLTSKDVGPVNSLGCSDIEFHIKNIKNCLTFNLSQDACKELKKTPEMGERKNELFDRIYHLKVEENLASYRNENEHKSDIKYEDIPVRRL